MERILLEKNDIAKIVQEASDFILKKSIQNKNEVFKAYLHSTIIQTSIMTKDVKDGIKTPADLKQLVGNLGTFINQKMGFFIPRIWEKYGESKDYYI